MQPKLYLYVLAVLTAISSAYVGSTLANTGSPGHVPRPISGQLARLVRDINTAPAGSDPANLTNVGGTLFFTAITPETGRELWKSDGTAEGTVLVRDIFPGVESSAPANLTNVGGTLFFTIVSAPGVGTELWKSDGTAEGTVLVRN